MAEFLDKINLNGEQVNKSQQRKSIISGGFSNQTKFSFLIFRPNRKKHSIK